MRVVNFFKNFVFFFILGSISFVIIFGSNQLFSNKNQDITSNNIPQNTVENSSFNSTPVLSYGKTPTESKEFEIKTEVFNLVFSPKGGTISHIYVRPNESSTENIDLVFGKENQNAFEMKFGNYRGNIISENFFHEIEKNGNETNVIFTKTFTDKNGVPFELKKKYRFYENEYMIELTIEINSDKKIPFLSNESAAYTLAFLPQIGPEFIETSKKNKSGSANYRDFVIYKDEKLRRYSDYERVLVSTRVDWVGIESRYFAALGIEPKLTRERIILDKYSQQGYVASEIFFERKKLEESRISDTYRFYIGPRVKKELVVYNNANDNAFGYADLNLDVAGAGRGIIAAAIKGVMNFIHNQLNVVNWGWVIIILTILIKLILIPFSMSQMKSSAAMQKLQPKLKEIQEKYKNNPQKQQQEMANFYRENKINPMKGCLPMILQMIILIPLFNLLRADFDLFQEPFILWINDLSSPDAIWTWEKNIPLISSFTQNSIRILPILFVVTQIISMKIMQTGAESSANKQMKIMMYLLPVIFFFTLYNMPSGLFIYWVTMNILSVVQQVIYNIIRKKKGKEVVVAGPSHIPHKKRKK